MTLMGLVKNWAGLLAARFFLGLCEAGLFPGVNYYLSCWYKRDELGVRLVSLALSHFAVVKLRLNRQPLVIAIANNEQCVSNFTNLFIT
jgi:MFS family permease